jgi:hypothetical protein
MEPPLKAFEIQFQIITLGDCPKPWLQSATRPPKVRISFNDSYSSSRGFLLYPRIYHSRTVFRGVAVRLMPLSQGEVMTWSDRENKTLAENQGTPCLHCLFKKHLSHGGTRSCVIGFDNRYDRLKLETTRNPKKWPRTSMPSKDLC